MMDLPVTVFGAAGLFYAVLIPLVFVQVMALVFIPSMMSSGAKALHVGKAIFCYAMQGLGVVLMSISGLPAVYSVLIGAPLMGNIYLGLLIIFAIGGFLFLRFEHKASNIDDASRLVPYALFFYTVKFVGAVLVVGSLLSLTFSMLTLGNLMLPDFWIIPTLFLLYGMLLSACTKWPRLHPQNFQNNTMKKPPMAPVKPTMVAVQRPATMPMNKKQQAAMTARKK
jgi:hypothetical protein